MVPPRDMAQYKILVAIPNSPRWAAQSGWLFVSLIVKAKVGPTGTHLQSADWVSIQIDHLVWNNFSPSPSLLQTGVQKRLVRPTMIATTYRILLSFIVASAGESPAEHVAGIVD